MTGNTVKSSLDTSSATHIVALPDRLSAAVNSIVTAGESANTRRSYRTALSYWSAWFYFRSGLQLKLPVEFETVSAFIVDHLYNENEPNGCLLDPEVERQLIESRYKAKPGPLKLSTIKQRIAVLSKAHELQGSTENPCRDGRLKSLLLGASRSNASNGQLVAQKDAATKLILDRMLATCDDSLVGIRDRAILLVGWSSGGRRRSELAQLNFSGLKKNPDGSYSLRLARSKTNQTGKILADKPVRGAAADALSKWLAAADITDGLVFRRLNRGEIGESITAMSISRMVKKRAMQAGLEGDFSAHSLRSGFVTEAGKRRIPLGDVMAMSEHRNTDTVLRYYRNGSLESSEVANLYD